MNWTAYHIGEEFFIAGICSIIALRAFTSSQSEEIPLDSRGRVFLVGSAFTILATSSAFHAAVHAYSLDLNLLYQTLFGYCLGLLTLIVALSSDRPWKKRRFPLLYIGLTVFLLPPVYSLFPKFGDFRPLVWVAVAYLSGIVCILYVSAYYRTGTDRYLLSSAGHALICTGGILLFFPAHIGSDPWIYGHLLRPMGFAILLISVRREDLAQLTGSFLYKALSAFSLVAAIPLVFFGTLVFYTNMGTDNPAGGRVIVFALMLATLASALLFGLGVIIRLIRPLLVLKGSIGTLADRGLEEQVVVSSNDEIGELSQAFNEMLMKLKVAMAEQDRLARLAATGELSATLAHEIRNPLNAIGGAATYIGENYDGSLIREFTRIIEHEVGRINKLTTALLNFAKPLTPEFAPADMNVVVSETVSLLEHEAREQGVTIETDLTEDVPAVSVDANQISQVLINLLINSLDAVDTNGFPGRIRIRTRVVDRSLTVSVEDNGKGISEENMKNIFNPFFTTKTRGTGLGLAMSKKISKEHGGDLVVRNVHPRGTEFTLALPIQL